MEKPMAITLGLALAGLAAAGFIKNKKIANEKHEKQLMGLMNVDTVHSMLRVPLAAAMLLSKKGGKTTERIALTGAGLIYLAIGALGLKDRKLGGMLPSKLTNFDEFYHFATGLAALWMGLQPHKLMHPTPKTLPPATNQ